MTSSTTDYEADDRLMAKLYPILGGHVYFQTLSAAVQLDLFGELKRGGPLALPEIARRLGIEEKPARILLLGCATLGLVCKSGAQYSNSEMASRFLVSDVPGNLVDIVKLEHFIIYRAMYSFYDALRANKNVGLKEFPGDEPTLYKRLSHQPELQQIFQDAMEAITVHGNQVLADCVDLSKVRYLVDVGGGNGENVLTLARKYPSLRASVFDLPDVCRIATANIRAAGFADRVNALPGECFKDEFPKGPPIAFCFAHFFTIWSEERDRALLEKCYRSLPAGGTVVIFNMMQWDNGDGPLSAALGSPYFITLATGEGMLYTWREYETWMKEAGFSQVRRQRLPGDHGAIIGKKV